MEKRGVTAKVEQNAHVRAALIATGTRKILEASGDRYWGAGRRLKDPTLLTVRARGKNTMGRILEEIRGHS